ncbi:NUDIX domain-containing protein [Nocardioidaceae bacterium]|nr:NUDIX domain-containing protein [Nocardioidaceae bacterium]
MDAVPHPPPRPPEPGPRPDRGTGQAPPAAAAHESSEGGRRRRQRLAAYAVICRPGAILLVRLAKRVSPQPRWTLPGGGVEFGEHPRETVAREMVEETGLSAVVGETARVYTGSGTVLDGLVDQHSVRLVYDAWVPLDAPTPRTVEVDGSTVEARWVPWDDIDSGAVTLVAWVREAVAEHRPVRKQRLSAYALATREHAGATQVLLARIGESIRHGGGLWTLPGGGIEHGENPVDAVRREVAEECGVGVEVGELREVRDHHVTGTAPDGRFEDFHGVQLVFAARVSPGADLRPGSEDEVVEAAWVDVARLRRGELPTTELVTAVVKD